MTYLRFPPALSGESSAICYRFSSEANDRFTFRYHGQISQKIRKKCRDFHPAKPNA